MRQAPLTLGQAVAAHLRLRKLGVRDSKRSITLLEWNRRSCRLASGVSGLGLCKGDRVAVLADKCVERAEIDVAVAEARLIAGPISFRLVPAEAAFIIKDCAAAAVIAPRRALALVDVVTSQSAVSSDATKGLGFVPDDQPLVASDDAERRRRGLP